jgi:hypothetical protein
VSNPDHYIGIVIANTTSLYKWIIIAIEDTWKMPLPYDCMYINIINEGKRHEILKKCY